MNGIQPRGQHLLDVIQVVQIGPRIAGADHAPAGRIDRRLVPLIAGLLDQHAAERRKQPAGPSMTRGHDAIEKIDAPRDGFQQVFRHTDAHEIAWFRRRQFRRRDVEHAVHVGLAFADRKSSDGIAVRSEEHTSELQSHVNLVCRLLLEKKNKHKHQHINHNKNKHLNTSTIIKFIQFYHHTSMSSITNQTYITCTTINQLTPLVFIYHLY